MSSPTQLPLDYNLYDGTPPHEAAATSHAAAESIRPDVNRLQAVVLAAIRDAGAEGLTDEQGIEATGVAANTWRPRRRELEMLGRIKDSERVRRTQSGRLAKVWVGC